MAITIIKEGRVPEKKFRVTCKRCGTIYEFLDTDARKGCDEKELKLMWSINCPLCGEIAYVSEKDVLKQRI